MHKQVVGGFVLALALWVPWGAPVPWASLLPWGSPAASGPAAHPIGDVHHLGVASSSANSIPAGRYAAPVAPLRVVRGFSPPSHAYGAGHLGVDLAAGPTTAVSAAADGTVTFSGQVAGRGVVVISHPDGVRTEYEPVRATVARGARVRLGQVIGQVEGGHRGCTDACLHWGARRAGSYLDPLLLLHQLGVVRLLPWDG